MQARLLITSGPRDALELADALLVRIADQDPRGEVAFYRAVSLIRQRGALPDILALLEDAAEQRHPHALALLYKIHNEPYLAPRADRARALRYRQAYAELDVAKSGYPSSTPPRKTISPATRAATGTPSRYSKRLPASAGTFSPGSRVPARFSGSLPLTRISSPLGGRRRTSRSRATASGSANCSPLM